MSSNVTCSCIDKADNKEHELCLALRRLPQKRLTVCNDCSDAIYAPMLSVSSQQKHTHFACISMQQSELHHTDKRSLKYRSGNHQ